MNLGEEKMPRLVAEGHDQWFSRISEIRNSRITASNLAIMNLAIHGIEADFGPEIAAPLRRDLEAGGEGWNLAPRGLPAEARATSRENRIARFERSTHE